MAGALKQFHAEPKVIKHLGSAHFSGMMRALNPVGPGGFVRSLAEMFR